MALTFFWRCEGTTLDGTDDFSAGDTTATANNSPAISATAMRVGTNGLLFDAISERYDFNPASIMTPGEGVIGGWFQFPSVFTGTDAANLFLCRGTASNDHIRITTQSVASERRLTLSIRNNTGGEARLQMSSGNLTAGNWYFFVGRWNSSIDYRSIAVYDTSMALVDETEDPTTDFSANVPADFASSSGLRFGDSTGSTGTLYLDNIFIASNYDEPIEDNSEITSYTEYGDTGGELTGSGALTIGTVTASGEGARGLSDLGGPIALSYDLGTQVSGTGDSILIITGTGALVVDALTLEAVGNIGRTGTGDLTITAVQVSGFDIGAGLEDNGKYRKLRVFIVSSAGRTRWVSYIPVKQFPNTTEENADRYTPDGALTVEFLGSSSGLTEWVDYIPVVEVADPDTGKWRYDDNGFLPVVAIV